MQVEYAKVSALGDREDNQDRAAVVVAEEAAIILVFDGMGGHSDGARAAEIADERLERRLLRGIQHKAVARLHRIGDIVAEIADPAAITMDMVESNVVRCPDPETAERMIALIDAVRKDQDSIGGMADIESTPTGKSPGV